MSLHNNVSSEDVNVNLDFISERWWEKKKIQPLHLRISLKEKMRRHPHGFNRDLINKRQRNVKTVVI